MLYYNWHSISGYSCLSMRCQHPSTISSPANENSASVPTTKRDVITNINPHMSETALLDRRRGRDPTPGVRPRTSIRQTCHLQHVPSCKTLLHSDIRTKHDKIDNKNLSLKRALRSARWCCLPRRRTRLRYILSQFVECTTTLTRHRFHKSPHKQLSMLLSPVVQGTIKTVIRRPHVTLASLSRRCDQTR